MATTNEETAQKLIIDDKVEAATVKAESVSLSVPSAAAAAASNTLASSIGGDSNVPTSTMRAKPAGSCHSSGGDTIMGHWKKSQHPNDGFSRYGSRDLVGYGSNAPVPTWPDRGKVALNFTINLVGGGEASPLHGDHDSTRGTTLPASKHVRKQAELPPSQYFSAFFLSFQ